ncbi:MAG: S-adenosylmethionine:tRNA ribosyltransferase-isomerase [Chloroflexota bacterium]
MQLVQHTPPRVARTPPTHPTKSPILDTLDFTLPPELEAHEPPEARGLTRNQVRLVVSYQSNDHVAHTSFTDLPDLLQPGDVVVINTSGTLNAALEATRADGQQLVVHLSTQLPAQLWIVEVRQPGVTTTQPFYDAKAGETLQLPGGASVTLLAPHHQESTPRLWIARLHTPEPLTQYAAQYGTPIRYSYVTQHWPAEYYQTVYATEPGSAEMPSAGRPFTTNCITQLVARGIQVVPLILHTGVSSLEAHEPPYEEYYRVSPETANVVNAARANGKRIIAVGTTVVRALETVTDTTGRTYAGAGWTDLVITPQRGIRAIDSLLTGLHEPRASHLAMLEALANRRHLHLAYTEALRERYRWHEFGDLHLILP